VDNQHGRRWQVKDTIQSEWRELPGEFTATEVWEMLMKGAFRAARPAREEEQTPVGSD
jgi:hypothetical protein